MRYATPKNWEKYFEEVEGVQISHATIRARIAEVGILGTLGKNKNGKLLRHSFYSESDVRRACEYILQGGPQADKYGIIKVGNRRYRSSKSWAKEFSITAGTINVRLKDAGIQGIKGREYTGKICYFYHRSDIQSACSNLIGIPEADDDGFYEKDGERYGTIMTWAELFNIAQFTAKNRLKEAKKKSIKVRNRSGVVHSFYSESDAREACADLAKDMPHANEDGFFVIDGEKFGTIRVWSIILGISKGIVKNKLREGKKKWVRGKGVGGQIRHFYKESDIKDACADTIVDLPRSDESGFFEQNGERYGTTYGWAKTFSLSENSVAKRFKKIRKKSVKGKDKGGRIYNFYSENDARSVCADLLQKLPQANKKGFFVRDGERYGIVSSWAKVLLISVPSIKGRLKEDRAKSIRGKVKGGHICDFYSESDVRSVCSRLIEDMPSADKEGFIYINGEKYSTVVAWARILPISQTAIISYLERLNKQGIKGKVKGGNICDFYSETDVRESCADLMADLPQSDESGFFEREGVKYGTVSAWSRALCVSRTGIAKRINNSKLRSIKGKTFQGQIYVFYSEPDVLETCADLFSKSRI